jgi:hypothetical protein
MYESDEHGGAREDDPETSHEAAHSLDPTRLYGIIVKILLKIGPATTHEIADASDGIGWGSISPRMKKMEEKGLVYRTGEARADRGGKDRKPTNRKSIVWDLCSRRDMAAVAVPVAGEPPEDRRRVLAEMTQAELFGDRMRS